MELAGGTIAISEVTQTTLKTFSYMLQAGDNPRLCIISFSIPRDDTRRFCISTHFDLMCGLARGCKPPSDSNTCGRFLFVYRFEAEKQRVELDNLHACKNLFNEDRLLPPHQKIDTWSEVTLDHIDAWRGLMHDQIGRVLGERGHDAVDEAIGELQRAAQETDSIKLGNVIDHHGQIPSKRTKGHRDMSDWRLTVVRNGENEDRYKTVPSPLLLQQRFAHHTDGDARHHLDHYIPTDDVVAAVNTALELGKPLLVAGEPGVGKTELAKWIADRLDLFSGPDPEVLRFDVKSTSKGSDLIYRYDAISHFREAGGDKKVADYIDLEPLGQAIALACKPEDLPKDPGLQALVEAYLKGREHPRLSVVLIDEIDKAPRDVPNDLLRALDEMAFRIDELGPAPC